MCGIVSYLGNKKNGTNFLLNGLSLLEYRGYDSVGIGYHSENKINICKIQGTVATFKQQFDEHFSNTKISIGIGHTRWATHGVPTSVNAHPHLSYSKRFVTVHNGIIENYRNLKEELRKHNVYQISETDTEIFVNYLDYELQKNNLTSYNKLVDALQHIKGSFAIATIDIQNPNKVFLFRRRSPLCIAIDKQNNLYVSSDMSAFVNFADSVCIVPDNCMLVLEEGGKCVATNIESKTNIKLDFKSFTHKGYAVTLDGYKHFLLKEIEEQPFVLKSLITEYYDDKHNKIADTPFKKDTLKKLHTINSVYFIGCGTSFHAAKFGEYIMEHIASVKVFSESGGEIKYRNIAIDKNTLYIFLSQSGETADLIAPLEMLKHQGCYTLAICNVFNSTLTHLADDTLYMKAGPEISVASTKAFTAQMMLLIILAQKIAQYKRKDNTDFKKFVKDIKNINEVTDYIFKQKNVYQTIAKKNILPKTVILFLGRNLNFPIALEGALKMKEISYKNCDGMQMGELKHGALALVDTNSISLACESKIEIYDKYISNVKEVLSRSGTVLSICPDNFYSIKEANVIELSYPNRHFLVNTFANVIVFQLLSYFVATTLNVDIDKPRNLAKSVTVE